MKIFIATTLTLGLFLATGCRTYDVNGSVPVRYATSVIVIPYDHIQRPVPLTIQIFDNFHVPPTNYVAIASLERNGHRNDAALIIGALEWRARQLGANGIILLGTEAGEYHPGIAFANVNGGFATGGSQEPVFRAIAISYEPAK